MCTHGSIPHATEERKFVPYHMLLMLSPDYCSKSNSLTTPHSMYPMDVVDQDMLHQSE